MAYPGGPGTIMNPSVPLCIPVEGGISHGKMILIQGTCPYGSDGLGVNLQQTYSLGEPRPNTGLHFNVRFNEHCVVRNSLIGGGWGTEERHGGLPFQHGVPFELIILVENSAFKIAVNGKHFTEFNHRIQKEQCGFLRIDGNCQISFIKFQGGPKMVKKERRKTPVCPSYNFQTPNPPSYNFPTPNPPSYNFPTPNPPSYNFPAGGANFSYGGGMAQPMYNPPVPLVTKIPGGLSQGKMIFITGVPHPNCSRFTINLQQGQYPNCDVGMHFDVRLNYGGVSAVVVRTHRQGGAWGTEERHQNYFPFAPNAQFDIIILVEKQGYKIAVNNQHYVEFHHRIRPIHKLDTLDINGDVRLTQVRFQ